MIVLIRTKYHGPTDTKPARISAQLLTNHSRQLADNRAFVSYHDGGEDCPHNRAVLALLDKLKQQHQAPDPYSLQGAAILAPGWHRTGVDNPTGYTYAATSGFPSMLIEV